VVKSELIQALKDKSPEFQERDVELAVNCILKQLADTLAQGERIEIRGFGSFDCFMMLFKTVRQSSCLTDYACLFLALNSLTSCGISLKLPSDAFIIYVN
jgi:hypothetical protein